ncbi:hypothetical protein IQ247_14515 [Plectonema cf. radiosum LEGE 06105]|uniref:Lipopolysaccharide assembly protein A domain-containing protein n=1 Tax=Plectonema cf. radiosum LEGE 06105 TaxID=945769 RepID=A0A8J7F855_9CYAN|nr:hypothetical protein [Plectonema radiosum]MBE9213864.1 hypothetical protein [Plectonema cf. radiosum LEGE 06105]
MSLSALTKFILPPVLASAAVFSAMTIPLAAIGDKQINIKFQEETLFFGKLRDVALPYVVVSTGLSLGAGIAAVAICGWRNSSRKSAEIEEQLSQLEQQLQQKEELLKEFKLSESRLQVSGLNNFLDEQVSLKASKSYPTLNPPNASQLDVEQIPPQADKASHSVLENKKRDTTPANAASGFASAQNFLGYTQSSNNIKKELVNISQTSQTSITPAEFEQLQRQLRDMMLQMQAMQNNLPLMTQSTNNIPTKNSETINIYYDTHEPQQIKFI